VPKMYVMAVLALALLFMWSCGGHNVVKKEEPVASVKVTAEKNRVKAGLKTALKAEVFDKNGMEKEVPVKWEISAADAKKGSLNVVTGKETVFTAKSKGIVKVSAVADGVTGEVELQVIK